MPSAWRGFVIFRTQSVVIAIYTMLLLLQQHIYTTTTAKYTCWCKTFLSRLFQARVQASQKYTLHQQLLEPEHFHPAERDPKWPSLLSHLALAPGIRNMSLLQGMFKPTSEGRALLGFSGKVPCCYENFPKQAINLRGTLGILEELNVALENQLKAKKFKVYSLHLLKNLLIVSYSCVSFSHWDLRHKIMSHQYLLAIFVWLIFTP